MNEISADIQCDYGESHFEVIEHDEKIFLFYFFKSPNDLMENFSVETITQGRRLPFAFYHPYELVNDAC